MDVRQTNSILDMWVYIQCVCAPTCPPKLSVNLKNVKLTPLKFFFKVTKSMHEA